LGNLCKATEEHPNTCRQELLIAEREFTPSFVAIEEGWSVRVGSRYRALAVEVDAGLLWFWIGSHAEYDAIV
jgi:hypothetical protein